MNKTRMIFSSAALVIAGLCSASAQAYKVVYSEPTPGGRTRFVIMCDDGFATDVIATSAEALLEMAPLICGLHGSSMVNPPTPGSPGAGPGTRFNFSGAHVELIAGFDSSNRASGGVLNGLAVGYDLRRGGAVFGVEAEVADSASRQCDAGFCVTAGRDLYLGGRAGAVVGENVLIYAKAGYANARVTEVGNLSYFNSNLGGAGAADLNGVRAGAGVEWLAGKRFSVRTEYRYSNYGGGFARHQAIVGLGLRF